MCFVQSFLRVKMKLWQRCQQISILIFISILKIFHLLHSGILLVYSLFCLCVWRYQYADWEFFSKLRYMQIYLKCLQVNINKKEKKEIRILLYLYCYIFVHFKFTLLTKLIDFIGIMVIPIKQRLGPSVSLSVYLFMDGFWSYLAQM